MVLYYSVYPCCSHKVNLFYFISIELWYYWGEISRNLDVSKVCLYVSQYFPSCWNLFCNGQFVGQLSCKNRKTKLKRKKRRKSNLFSCPIRFASFCLWRVKNQMCMCYVAFTRWAGVEITCFFSYSMILLLKYFDLLE